MIWFQRPVDDPEEFIVMFRTDVLLACQSSGIHSNANDRLYLDHLDADESVEQSLKGRWKLTVI